jgi:proteasome lid subunit RPN8/RPN11
LAKDLVEKLSSFYSEEGVERGGYLTKEDVVECVNVHVNPIEGFCFTFDDLDKLENEEIVATFHTHPNGHKNLSKEDLYPMEGDSNEDDTCHSTCLMKNRIFAAHLHHRSEWDRCAFLRFCSLLS